MISLNVNMVFQKNHKIITIRILFKIIKFSFVLIYIEIYIYIYIENI